MHGVTVLDALGAVVRPALIWCDQRSQPQVDAINAKLGAEAVLRATANPVLTGFTLPKFLWIRDHEPAVFERIRHLLLPKDFIRYRLTGEFATDVSDASGTALFDVAKRQWSGEMASGLGLDAGILPRAVESVELTGTVTAEAAERTGLRAGTPVAGGAGDQAASAIGNGIVEPGIASCTIGTSGVVFAHLEEPAYDPGGRVHTFCHAVPGKWHVMGVTQGAGLSLEWFRNQFAPDSSFDSLMAEAAAAPAGSQGLQWLPYLMGERTPHLDAIARGGWIGLTASHTRAHLIRAVMEGVAYSQRDGLEIVQELGCDPQTIRLSGGGARSPLWRQVFADVFRRRVASLESQQGSAYGAGLLGMVGTGAFSSVEEACAAAVREVDTVNPRGHESARYERGYEVYRSLYPALRPVYPLMS
jgi:xylulokinase